LRFYIDTSVFGGYFDNEFKSDTKNLFYAVDANRIEIVTSITTSLELQKAPSRVKKLVDTYKEHIELLEFNPEIEKLSEFYIKEGALTRKFITDAQHIAFASIARVDALISWNFLHMVNFFKIRQYNAINLRHGYPIIDIRSPREVLL
jgi:predicted nucleic acid-binding protein